MGKMHNIKPYLKYNKKVCVIPYEKLDSLISKEEEGKESTEEDSPQTLLNTTKTQHNLHNKEEQERADEEEEEEEKIQQKSSDRVKKTVDLVEFLDKHFEDDRAFANALMISNSLHLDPMKKEADKKLLLTTQTVNGQAGLNELAACNYLCMADIPDGIILNRKLCGAMKKLYKQAKREQTRHQTKRKNYHQNKRKVLPSQENSPKTKDKKSWISLF